MKVAEFAQSLNLQQIRYLMDVIRSDGEAELLVALELQALQLDPQIFEQKYRVVIETPFRIATEQMDLDDKMAAFAVADDMSRFGRKSQSWQNSRLWSDIQNTDLVFIEAPEDRHLIVNVSVDQQDNFVIHSIMDKRNLS